MSDKLIIGCGYLGSRVAQQWMGQGNRVFALTRTAARAGQLSRLGVTPLVGDVLVPDSLPALPQVETVLYAIAPDRKSGAVPREVSIRGLHNMLPRLAGAARLIYISSTSVYGQNGGEWVDENSPCEPESENGRICLEAEQILRRAAPPVNILRLAGLYGPGRLIARVDALRSGVPIGGNPEAWLNLIHVEDAAATVPACERHGKPGETYVVCDDRPIPRREYYELVARLAETPAPVFDGASGAASTELNKRCCNRRLHEALEVALRFPTIFEGVPQALAAISR